MKSESEDIPSRLVLARARVASDEVGLLGMPGRAVGGIRSPDRVRFTAPPEVPRIACSGHLRHNRGSPPESGADAGMRLL